MNDIQKKARELLAEIHEIAGNQPAVFTLRNVGIVGTVFEQQAAAIEHALSSPPNVGEGDKPSPELVEAVYKRLRGLKLSNMADADTGDPYPLVDAVSAEGQSIASGEEQLGEIAFEAAEAALNALSTPPHDRATIRREAFDEAAKVAVAAIGRTNEHLAGWNDACREIDRRINALKETPDGE